MTLILLVLTSVCARAGYEVPHQNDCLKLLYDHVDQFDPESYGYQTIASFDEQMNMRQEATVLFRLSPVSGVPKVASEFAKNNPGLTIPDSLMLERDSSFFFVAQGPMQDLRLMKAQLVAQFPQVVDQPTLKFQVLDSVVTRMQEIGTSLLPQGYWIDLRTQSFETTLADPLGQIGQIRNKGFLIRDPRSDAALFVYSADRYESIFRSKDLMALARITRFVVSPNISMTEWASELVNLRSLINRNPVALRYRDYYVVNYAAQQALQRLAGYQAKVRARGSVLVSKALRDALAKCLTEYCHVPEQEVDLMLERETVTPVVAGEPPPVIITPPVAQANSPAPVIDKKPETLTLKKELLTALVNRFKTRSSEPSGAPPKVIKPKSAPVLKPKASVPTGQEVKAKETQPAFAEQAIFSPALLRKLATLSMWRVSLDADPIRASKAAGENLGRLKIQLGRYYEETVKPLLKSYEDNVEIARSSAELRTLAEQELPEINAHLQGSYMQIIRQFRATLPDENRAVLVEIGPESGQSWNEQEVKMLLRMYQTLATQKGWGVDIVDETTDRVNGLYHVVLRIEGQDSYSLLQFERGTHKLRGRRSGAAQGSKQGQDYTHFLEVRVYPEVKVPESTLNEKDVRFETMRASGKGGQHVNKTDSAVRATHIRSGITVRVESQRSQHQNKATALAMIAAELNRRSSVQAKKQRDQSRDTTVSGLDGNPFVRIYDYRTTNYELDKIVEGGIQDLLEEQLNKKTESQILELPD